MADGSYQIGNQKALKHGAHGAFKRFCQGAPFIGYALEVQKRVEAAAGLALDALTGLERQRAERYFSIEATRQMFDDAANSAAAEGDVEAWAKRKRWALYASDKASKEQDKLEAMLSERADGVIQDAIEVAGDE